MKVGSFRLRLGRGLAAVLLVVAWSAAAVRPVAAASASFGSPTATSTWGKVIVFRQPATISGDVGRVEILIGYPGASGPLVQPVPAPSASGPTVLEYDLDASAGVLRPNTVLTASWRIVGTDGTTVVAPSVTVRYDDTRFTWQTRTGSVIRVHWYSGPASFADRALSIGETAVATASSLLGVTESAPIDFFIYADQASFYDAIGPGARENVGGQANPEIRTLFTYITPAQINDPWVGVVVPHELTHIVFDTAVQNPYHYPPRWLNEGLAVYLSQGYDSSDRAATEQAAADGSLMPLDALIGQFPTTADRFSLAYSESVSAVDFLIRTYGRPALVKVIRAYATGITDDQAFTAGIGMTVAGFDAAWLRDLNATSPLAYGPLPAPPGPLPAGWTSVGGTVASAPPGGVGASPSTDAGPASPGPASGGRSGALLLAMVALVLAGGGLALLATGRRRRARDP